MSAIITSMEEQLTLFMDLSAYGLMQEAAYEAQAGGTETRNHCWDGTASFNDVPRALSRKFGNFPTDERADI